jgi:type IV pilus assembly protein PilB
MSESMGLIHTAPPKRVGDVLIDLGVITPEQLGEALALQKRGGGKLVGEIIIELGFCGEAQVAEALAMAYHIPFARLNPNLADPAALKLLPLDFVKENTVLPLFKVDGMLTVAVTEPSNLFLAEEIAQRADCPVQIVVATAEDIRSTLEQRNRQPEEFELDAVLQDADKVELGTSSVNELDLKELQSAGGASPVVALVNHAIFSAICEGASDIHFEPDDRSMRIRFRIDGRLVPKTQPPFQMHPAITSRIKIMAGLDISERRLPQDGAIRVNVEGKPIDLRVSTLPNKFGEKVVIRVIDNRNVLVGLDELGMPAEMCSAYRELVHKPYGIILVTGPTGSGKSTTLYSSLNEINRTDINICTVEDPVEFNLAGVNQFQVHERIGLGFAGVLRSLLRQDPDVIMVGEIRDSETAKIAVQAALTGHMVLSTLHTNDAASAVTRLVNLGVEPFLVSAALTAVVAQRLVRKICPHCKVAETPSPPAALALQRLGLQVDDAAVGRGCSKCNQIGLKGRMGIYELLVPDEVMRDAITSGASLESLRKLAIANGMTTLVRTGLERVKQELTTVDEILRVAAG